MKKTSQIFTKPKLTKQIIQQQVGTSSKTAQVEIRQRHQTHEKQRLGELNQRMTTGKIRINEINCEVAGI